MKRVTTAILALVAALLAACGSVRAAKPVSAKHLIVPGVGVGDFKLGMSKGDVLKNLGEPKIIYGGSKTYTLEDLPSRYCLFYGHIDFQMADHTVQMIKVWTASYKLANGLGVGDPADRIKQAFGRNVRWDRGALICADRRLSFNFAKDNTVSAISISRPPQFHYPTPGPIVLPKIDRRPAPDTRLGKPKELSNLPAYDPDSDDHRRVAFGGRDLSKLDLRNSIDVLLYAGFDRRTVWPARERMPSGFDPQKIIESGKNPGLGLRSLHKKGITGRGVRIAIIDQRLLVDHREYADRLQLYEEIGIRFGTNPQMHGPAMASIAVGKTVGVAPEAELFYIAIPHGSGGVTDVARWRKWVAAIHRIIEINEQLPEGKKIRAISMSIGWGARDARAEQFGVMRDALRKARAAGMLAMPCPVGYAHEGFKYDSFARSPLADPDVLEPHEVSQGVGEWFWESDDPPSEGCFFIPNGSRTSANATGIDAYDFSREGGSSPGPPYIVGLYALAVQADPAITPERFWALAAKTGRMIRLERDGKRRSLGPIVNPVRLIRSIEAAKKK